MINVDEKKAKIVESIKARGPSLPIQIAKDIQLSSLFTSAILSEMLSAKMLKVSSLKVGGSPLYLISGQEAELEKFSQYLGIKEKEVLLMLTEKKIIEEEKMHPAHRVAVRDIKDFAFPLKVSHEGKERTFWRLYSFSTEQALEEINKRWFGIKQQDAKPAEHAAHEQEIPVLQQAKTTEKKDAGPAQMPKGKPASGAFHESVAEFCRQKGIIILEELPSKKKDAAMKINLPSAIGAIEMILLAKDKKSITETDVSVAYSEGQAVQLPILLMATGKPNKKALGSIEKFKSRLIFRQL